MSRRRWIRLLVGMATLAVLMDFGGRPAAAFTEDEDFNFFGVGAGESNTSVRNSFFGGFAGQLNTSGSDNSFFGGSAGISNTTGSFNSFFGADAGFANTGSSNSFFGRRAGWNNTGGAENSFFGEGAGLSNTTGSLNAFFGRSAGSANTTGGLNSFFGHNAGLSNTIGGDNAFFGRAAGSANTSGSFNSFFGDDAGQFTTTGGGNSFFGEDAGKVNTTGMSNSFFGQSAGLENTTGTRNSFFGHEAGMSMTNETANSFLGALSDGFAGITNATAVGFRALVSQANSLVLGSIQGVNGAGSSVNVGIGTATPAAPLHVVKTTPGGVAASVNEGALGVNRTDGSPANIRFSNLNRSYLFQNNPTNQVFSIINETAGNTPFSIFPDATSNNFVVRSGRWGLGVGAPAAGRAIDTNTGAFLSTAGVWTDASSRSLKSNIESLSVDEALEVLTGLDPVTFTYKRAPGDQHVGFIAEDVPDLVATAGRKGLSSMDIVAVAVRVLQQADDRLDAKDAEIASLESRVSTLESPDRR